jgi:hypothetical protein
MVDNAGNLSHSEVFKIIIKQSTDHVIVFAFDEGESLPKKMSPFEIFKQVVNARPEIVIDDLPQPGKSK